MEKLFVKGEILILWHLGLALIWLVISFSTEEIESENNGSGAGSRGAVCAGLTLLLHSSVLQC